MQPDTRSRTPPTIAAKPVDGVGEVPRLHRPGDAASESGIRQATTTARSSTPTHPLSIPDRRTASRRRRRCRHRNERHRAERSRPEPSANRHACPESRRAFDGDHDLNRVMVGRNDTLVASERDEAAVPVKASASLPHVDGAHSTCQARLLATYSFAPRALPHARFLLDTCGDEAYYACVYAIEALESRTH